MGQIIDAMPLYPSTTDILIRILLSVAAGALVGFNRQRGNHAAGLRTTILITLAACLAMIQANLLLSAPGRTDASFASMDILRLPLGILTGVGFIGGGAILRRADGVAGATTAATIWIMTVIGLCFGGGQIRLGLLATVVAFVVLVPFKFFDRRMKREFDADITLRIPGATDPFTVANAVAELDYEVRLVRLVRIETGEVDISYASKWLANDPAVSVESMLKNLGERFTIIDLDIAPST